MEREREREEEGEVRDQRGKCYGGGEGGGDWAQSISWGPPTQEATPAASATGIIRAGDVGGDGEERVMLGWQPTSENMTRCPETTTERDNPNLREVKVTTRWGDESSKPVTGAHILLAKPPTSSAYFLLLPPVLSPRLANWWGTK